jgi:hypothetical protein
MAFVGSFSSNNTTTIKSDGTQTQTYGEVTGVGSSTLTTIISYTALTKRLLKQVHISGSNIATYSVIVNSTTVMKERTYFGGSLNGVFNFDTGLRLSISDIVYVKVIHSRPMTGDFNATIFTEEDSL